MFVIDEIVVSSEVLKRKFVCNLDKCKGACCWEGEFGAPVKAEEIPAMEDDLEHIKPLLSEESLAIIDQDGVAPYDTVYEGIVTPIKKNGACVYLFRDSDGVSKCAWEVAYKSGKSTFYKPISCHLYPLRVHSNEQTGWEALNYDEWDICSAACQLGEELNMPVFRFVKEALIRAYGEEFYEQLEGFADYQNQKEESIGPK